MFGDVDWAGKQPDSEVEQIFLTTNGFIQAQELAAKNRP